MAAESEDILVKCITIPRLVFYGGCIKSES